MAVVDGPKFSDVSWYTAGSANLSSKVPCRHRRASEGSTREPVKGRLFSDPLRRIEVTASDARTSKTAKKLDGDRLYVLKRGQFSNMDPAGVG